MKRSFLRLRPHGWCGWAKLQLFLLFFLNLDQCEPVVLLGHLLVMLLQNIFDVLCFSFLPARFLHGRNPAHNRLWDYLLLHGILLLIIFHLLNLLDSLIMTSQLGNMLQIHLYHSIILVGQSVKPSKQDFAELPIIFVTLMVLMPLSVIIFADYIFS